MGEDVGADQIVLLGPPPVVRRIGGDGLHGHYPVENQIFLRDHHRVGVEVEGVHGGEAAKGPGNGQDPGAASGVQQTQTRLFRPQTVDDLEAERCGGVLPRAEAHARVDGQDLLSRLPGIFQPAGQDEEPFRDLDGVEILLPRLAPVDAGEDGTLKISGLDPQFLPQRQLGPDPGFGLIRARFFEAVDRMDHPRVFPVDPGAELQFQSRKHFRRKTPVRGKILEGDAIKGFGHSAHLARIRATRGVSILANM